jgi:hypothetical protein
MNEDIKHVNELVSVPPANVAAPVVLIEAGELILQPLKLKY